MSDSKNRMIRFLEQQRELYGDELILTRAMYSSEPEKKVVRESLPELPTLQELSVKVAECRKCTLCNTRTQTVFGSGNTRAEIMFIGEAPGADEDEQGLPFVGRAGQLLTKMIEEPRSLGLPRSDVYIANILKCRPPGNRKPNADEIEQCEPYLLAQIENIRPRIICALGLTAANTLLRNTLSMAAMREKVFDYHGVPLMVTYHPAALLRNPNWKKPAWDDMLRLRALYEELKSKGTLA